MIISNNELRLLRMRLLFSQLEKEVILNELLQQQSEGKEVDISRLTELKRELSEINIGLKNIKIMQELYNDNIF